MNRMLEKFKNYILVLISRIVETLFARYDYYIFVQKNFQARDIVMEYLKNISTPIVPLNILTSP